MLQRTRPIVFSCMSGGVDSSVTAKLLQLQGHNIQPVFMRNWDTLDEQAGSGGCEWEKDFSLVQEVCEKNLNGVKPLLVDLSQEYWTTVFEPALTDWEHGVTPNPDVGCNRYVKFGALYDKLLGKDDAQSRIATGHYAQLLPSALGDYPELHRGAYRPKDQSYYLSTTRLDALKRTLFPVGSMPKTRVRELAHEWDLVTKLEKESMGICFVGKKKHFNSFISEYLEDKPGKIIDVDGKTIATHKGLWNYTVGERLRIGGQPLKYFVGRKDALNNTVTVVSGDSPLLMCCEIDCADFEWILPEHPSDDIDSPRGWTLQAQTRSLQDETECVVTRKEGGKLCIQLKTPIKGVSPGQFIVLYRDTLCLGGGTILDTRTLDQCT